MQRDHMETPKFQRKKKPFKVPVTERGHMTNVSMITRRSTMLPSDISHHFPKKGTSKDRVSFLSSTALEVTKVSDGESEETEYKLQYDEYLQGIMMEFIMKKKLEEREKSILTELVALAKEYDTNEEELHKRKCREMDIVLLSRAQNEIDAQMLNAKELIKKEEIEMIRYILSRLHTLLKPLDVFHCNNIVLPETPEEWRCMEQALQTCAKTLRSIMNIIGSDGDTYQSLIDGIKEFLVTYNDVEDLQKKLEKALCNLQILVLKVASLFVTEP